VIKPLVAVVGLALAGTGAAAGVYLALPSGSEQEVAQQVQATATVTPSAVASSSPITAASATPTGSPTPAQPTPTATAPAGWITYRDIKGFTFNYPAGWSIQPDDGSIGLTRIASFDLTNWKGAFPPHGVLVDLARAPLSPQLSAIPADSTEAVLGGVTGWTRQIGRGDNGGDADWTVSVSIGADRNGYRYGVSAAFKDDPPDTTQVNEIIKSFAFTD